MSATTDLVSIELFKEHARVSSQNEEATIVLYLETAREIVEMFTGTDYVSKVKIKTYTINQQIDSNIALTDIVSVSGYYKTLTEVADAYNYFINYKKGIIVNRDCLIDYYNLPTYTIKYKVTVDATEVPATVKRAILEIAAELYDKRETSGYASKELAINYKLLLKPYRKNI